VVLFVPTQVRQPVAAVRGWYSWPRLQGEHLEFDRVPAARTSKGPVNAEHCLHLPSMLAVPHFSKVHHVQHTSTRLVADLEPQLGVRRDMPCARTLPSKRLSPPVSCKWTTEYSTPRRQAVRCRIAHPWRCQRGMQPGGRSGRRCTQGAGRTACGARSPGRWRGGRSGTLRREPSTGHQLAARRRQACCRCCAVA
jgi:hypothetical protein